MPARIHLERMLHRNSVAVRGDSIASYALVKVIPAGDGSAPMMPVNLALVLDVSGSMYEEDGTGISRLKRVQQAALEAIPLLRPSDTLTIVAFGHTSAVALPPTPLTQLAAIEKTINTIDRFEIDPGGTAMDKGLQLALEQLRGVKKENTLTHVLLLTDGETSGEQNCRELAKSMADSKEQLTVVGVGTEWNASLVKDLAQLSAGKWYYVDEARKDDTQRVFLEEFAHLRSTVFRDVKLHIKPMKDIRVKRCRLVLPEIRELTLDGLEERHLIANLGTMERDKPTRYVLDLSLPQRPDGQYVIAQIEVSYVTSEGPGTTGLVPLQITYSLESPSYVNAEVAKHIDEVQIFELSNNLQSALESSNTDEAKRLAQAIERKATVLGPRGAKKTMLARQALAELDGGGKVSKKTMLALDDSARLAEEMPIP
ncbi:MAG: VWA domain-containing protein [Planctomycetia bacterium]|nr:VWA domain-containing protein [Planctomycetia bacterium]